MSVSQLLINRNDVSELIHELARRISYPVLAKEFGVSYERVIQWEKGGQADPDILWKLVRTSNKHGFFELLPPHGIPPVAYDLGSDFKLLAPPVGFEASPPLVQLVKRPTKIARYQVDFPLALPASVLAANAQWIEFYARRGFDILTYKTVRTQYRKEHPWPNWVFLENPVEIHAPFDQVFRGYPKYWPDEKEKISMANSFGVPSMAPDWWQDDVRRAREVIREGHQILIVSVTASTNISEKAMADDFASAAVMAAKAGADIIEANYSCPNVPGDPIGEVDKDTARAGRISKAIKDGLMQACGEKRAPPLFVKIGYLPESLLAKFMQENLEFVDGVVAINAISARIVGESGTPTFQGRETAGVSGWAIKARAQEVARNLVSLRNTLGKNFTILGLGGVLTEKDFAEYLDIGVDAVGSCTGAFLNPNLAIDIRIDTKALENRPSRFGFEMKLLGKLLGEAVLHPTNPARIRADSRTKTIFSDRQ